MKIPQHETTTAQLGAAYPFVSSAPLPGDRVVIGRDLNGTVFSYDPFDLYGRGVLTNPNMVVLGQVGRGKSALVKSYLYRQYAFGRRVVVIDPKGEYGAFAAATGGKTLSLKSDRATGLNPLGVPEALDSPHADSSNRQSILAGICAASLGRRLHVDESVALQVALDSLCSAVHREVPRTVSIREVVSRLLDPDDEVARALYLTRSQLAEMGRTPGYALLRLLGGEFGSMFDGAGSDLSDLRAGVVVLDVSAFYRSDALSVLLVCLFGVLQQIVQSSETPTICVVDEAWAVLANPLAAAFMQSFFKLARSFGVSNVLVAHRPSDLLGLDHERGASGEGDPALRHVQGLLADCETVVNYALSPSEAELSRRLFQMNDRQTDMLPALGRGVAFWNIGRQRVLVRHQLSDAERRIVNTDARMRLDER